MAAFFSEATLAFLSQLAENNNREWFREHQQQYEEVVRAPALALIEVIAPRLAEMAPHFVADSRKTGGSLMRIYRDTRFSRDKTPYKTNIGIQFRHELGKDVHAPGFYIHISPAEVFIGAGMWRPAADALIKLRTAIAEQPEDWLAARDDAGFQRWFALSGESLKRPPRGFSANDPLIEDIKRKDFIAISDLPPALVEQDDFDQIAVDYFAATVPWMRFLCQALRIPF